MRHLIKDQQSKKEKTLTKWQKPIKLLRILDGKFMSEKYSIDKSTAN